MAGNNTLKKLLVIVGGGLVPGAIIGFRLQYYKRVEEKEVGLRSRIYFLFTLELSRYRFSA